MKKVVVILPTYNEAENIKLLINKLQEIFSELENYKCSILVVDDNSPDETAKKVRKLQKKYKNIELLTGPKRGLGMAYIKGMRYAIDRMGADILFEMDADLSHDPRLIHEFLTNLEEGADFVIGTRYIKGGSIPENWAWERKLFSIVGNLIVRFGLMIPRIHDWSSGYRGIRYDVFETVYKGLDKYKGYTFQIAFLHRAINAGYKISEVPLNFIDRKYGKSKFIPVEYISNVLLYILLNSSFIRFGIVGLIGFIINAIGLEIFYRFGLHPGIAAAIGAEFAIMSNFTLHNFWSFSHKKVKRGEGLRWKFLHFNSVAVGAVVIQGLAVGLGTYFFGPQTRFIFLIGAIIFFIIPYSYFMYNRFIWNNE
jgi:dolichol-phosphate mannosyltransferase